MPVQKPMSLWISVAILGLSSAATPLVYRSLCPAIAPPRTLQALTELLSQAEPELLVVPILPDCPENGVWVCERRLTWEQLSSLRRVPEYAHQWQGVVLCEQFAGMTELVDTDTWGEYGLQIGTLLCFGDPALLRRIQKAIRDHQTGKVIPESGGKEIDQ